MQVPKLSFEDIECRIEEELTKSSLWPAKYQVFDVVKFLTKHLNAVLDDHCELDADVMGEVEFPTKNMRICVNINRDLTYSAENKDEPWIYYRWRMTVAHESIHIILHAPIFLSDNNGGDSRKHRCFKKNLDVMGSSENGKYGRTTRRLYDESEAVKILEYQANYGAAALLMPRFAFVPVARQIYDFHRQAHPNAQDEAVRKRVIADLVDRFHVSRQATTIRCKQLQKLKTAGMPTLVDL